MAIGIVGVIVTTPLAFWVYKARQGDWSLVLGSLPVGFFYRWLLYRTAATTLVAAVFGRYGTDPRSSSATFWNPGVKVEKPAKKRRKNEQKWARYGLRKRVRAAVL